MKLRLYEILQITLSSSFWGALSVNDNERQNLINLRWCIDVFAIRTTCQIHSFLWQTKYILYAHNVDTAWYQGRRDVMTLHLCTERNN